MIAGMRFPGITSRGQMSRLPMQYGHEASDEEDDLDCLPQSDIDSSRSAQSDDYCIRPEPILPLSEVDSASVGSASPSRHSGVLAGFGLVGSDLSEFAVGETDDDSDRDSDSDGEISNVNNLDYEDEDTCDSEVLLPPQLPSVSEEKLQEIWPLGDAAFAIFTCPITHDVMTDPVVSADGYTYERAAIARWFETSRKSPVTGQTLPHADLVPNQSVRTLLKMLIDMTEKEQALTSENNALQRKPSASNAVKISRSTGSTSVLSDSSDSNWFGSCESRRQMSERESDPKMTGQTGQTGQVSTRDRKAKLSGSACPGQMDRRNAAGSASASSSSSSSSSSGCQIRG